MSGQLDVIQGILLMVMSLQAIQVIGQWFIHSELMELNREVRRVATSLIDLMSAQKEKPR